MKKYSDVMAFLNALGLSDKMSSFTGRKRIQKSIYLLHQLGANLPFNYTWYVHGPYSPDLTRTLFNPQQDTTARELSKNELEIVNIARNFLAGDFYSADSLELIVSLVYLIKNGPREGLDNKQKIVDYLHSKKPQFPVPRIESAWMKIEESGLWKGDLGKLKG
jgi:uncharacterized protein YwgA